MKAVIKKYLWLWEFIGVALILSIGLLVVFKNQILYVVVGLIFAILGLLRIVTLIKTTKDKLLKWFYAIEIVINIGAGVTLVILGFKDDPADFQKIFGYIIGAILYLRGALYFFSTIMRKEGTDSPKFIAHLIFITVGTYIIAIGGFTVDTLGWIILALALLSSIFVAIGGIGHYRNYRNEYAASEETKKIKKIENKKEAPTAEEIIHDRDQDEPINKDEIQA